jgi:Secretion system C-terminal sorting domain
LTGNHTLRTWVRQASDTTYINDTATTTYFIPSAIANFASYNFNDGLAPQYWLAQGTVTVGIAAHGNVAGNGNLYANLWSSNKTISAITHRFGGIRNNKDSISYDFRFVNEASPFIAYVMNNLDTMLFQVATDCNEDWTTLDQFTVANHIQTTDYRTRKFGLGAYIGKNVRFRWRVISQITAITGYFFDLDNVNFLTCPESFGTKASVRNTRSGQSIGSIALTQAFGLAPFTYVWSNGRTTDSIGGLLAGNYTVTITDGRGCVQTGIYTVQNTVGTNDVTGIFSRVTIMPNPTSGNATLDVEFARPIDARVQILNIMGQPLSEMQAKGISQHQFQLDLSDRPAGVYLVRITADNRSHVARIVKQ